MVLYISRFVNMILHYLIIFLFFMSIFCQLPVDINKIAFPASFTLWEGLKAYVKMPVRSVISSCC